MRLRGLSVGSTRRVFGVVCAVALLCAVFMVVVHASAGAAAPFSISVSGNRLVDGSGNVIQLRGVNESGGEFACAGYPGWDFFGFPTDQTAVNALKSWKINAVRLPLNEACWLGIDGTGGTFGGQNYINAVAAYTNLLNANGIYVILDYHWGACGQTTITQSRCYANWQKSMPDRPNATTFWASVGATFKDNHAVLFDLFNEPHDNSDWNCWLNGGCTQYSGNAANQYVAEGMQPMLNAVRGAGATTQPVLLEGYSYANDFSGFMTHQPVDPSKATVLSLHLYDFNYPCATTACFDSGTYSIRSAAAIMPVIVGEFGQGSNTDANFDNGIMNWADTNSYSYLAWTWNTWGCGGAVIISDYNGTPCTPNGTAIKNHYLAVGGTTSSSSSASSSSSSASSSSTASSSSSTTPKTSTTTTTFGKTNRGQHRGHGGPTTTRP